MTAPHHEPRRLRRIGLLLLTAVLGLLGVLVPGPVGAAPAPTTAPFGPYAQTLSFEVADISPQVVTSTSDTTVRVQGTFTNTGPLQLAGLDVRFHRGEPLTDTAALQTELTEPSQPAAEITEPVPLAVPGDVVEPGASVPFDLSIDLLEAGLQVPGPGVYPLMININGAVVNGDSRQQARVGELHLLTTVLSLPGQAAPQVPEPLQVSTVRTLTDRPHLGVAGIFLDDGLATDVAPGGRLDLALAQLEAVPDEWAPTLVLDPMLVDELHRMTLGYRVVADPAAGQPALTPDDVARTAPAPTTEPSPTPTTTGPTTTAGGPSSTSASPSATASAATADPTAVLAPSTSPEPAEPTTEQAGTVPGTGGPAARDFLDRLTVVTGELDTIVLPYGNPDAVALTGAGMTATLQALAEQGRAVAGELLPASVRTDVAVPPGGWTDEATLAALLDAGYTTAMVVAPTVVEQAGALATLSAEGRQVPAVVAGAGDTRWWSDLFTTGTAPAVTLNAEVAGMVLHAGQGPLVGPLVLFDPSGTGQSTAGVAQALIDAGLIAGAPLPLADPAAPVATVLLPEEQRAALLGRPYLREVEDTLLQVASVSSGLSQADPNSPDPAALLDPLLRTNGTLYSTSLRDDPTPGTRVLDTVQGTVDQLRAGVALRFSTSYSLASSSSPLVFTVQNQLPYLARLQVKINGGQAVGLEITGNEVHAFPPGRTESVVLTSHVARSGAFSVDVGLVTPTGAVWSPAQPVTVTSSAYGFVTILIIVIAGVVLVVMVVFRIAQRIRQRGRPDRDVLVVTDPTPPDNPDPAGTSGIRDGSAAAPTAAPTAPEPQEPR